jgi:hypothetical protein
MLHLRARRFAPLARVIPAAEPATVEKTLLAPEVRMNPGSVLKDADPSLPYVGKGDRRAFRA